MSAFVADRMRTSTRRVRDEPSRSNSPAAITRSSFACCDGGTFAISSRNSVPPSASSNRPTRSARASVNAPRTWPNSSLSNTVSDTPPALTVTIGRAARGESAWIAWATSPLPVPFSPVISTLASEGAVRSMSSMTGFIAGDRAISGGAPSKRQARRAFELTAAAQRPAQFHLCSDDGEQPGVVPRLLHEVAGAAAHRLDRHIDARPGGQHDDRQRRVLGLQACQQIEAFLARRRIARVIQIDERGVEVRFVDRREHRRGRRHGLHLKAFALQEQLQGFENIALVVGEENTWGSG